MGMAISVPQFTVAELEEFPDDGNRYELLDGMPIVAPGPMPPHQVVALRIATAFVIGLQQSGHAMVIAPGAISAPPRTQLEPDVLVVPARFVGVEKWTDGTEHWLAVEVLSRSSRMYDRRYKRDAYLDLGVREAWLVDPEEKCIEATRVRGVIDTFTDTFTDTIEWRDPIAPVAVPIELRELFRGLP